jgi:hypothetical protein
MQSPSAVVVNRIRPPSTAATAALTIPYCTKKYRRRR